MNDMSIVRGMRYAADLDVVYMDTCRYAALGLLLAVPGCVILSKLLCSYVLLLFVQCTLLSSNGDDALNAVRLVDEADDGVWMFSEWLLLTKRAGCAYIGSL